MSKTATRHCPSVPARADAEGARGQSNLYRINIKKHSLDCFPAISGMYHVPRSDVSMQFALEQACAIFYPSW
jgi:hypothetical protein